MKNAISSYRALDLDNYITCVGFPHLDYHISNVENKNNEGDECWLMHDMSRFLATSVSIAVYM